MQAYDQQDKLMETIQGNLCDLEARKNELLTSGRAKQVSIGIMPKKGDMILINGLSFHVNSVITERVFLTLDRPNSYHK